MNVLRDSLIIARRNVIRIRRVPDVMVFVLIQPLMFVLLFAYVFGGSIAGSGLAEDLQKGLINRFRSLPMSRAAVVTGRTASDVVYNALSILVMSIAGLIVGWRIRGSLVDALIGYGVLFFFSYAFSWVMACIGLVVPTPEVVNNASFVVLFPMTFVANTFVPSDNLPGVLRTIAEWNPVSTLTHTVRVHFGNLPEGTPTPEAWPMQHSLVYSMAWAIMLIVIFAPLATRLYERSARR